MATDGVKIVDGDLGHDTYHGIMDLYDSGAREETILKEYPPEADESDDFFREIYVTARALALWEIGALSVTELHRVKDVIDLDAGPREWTKQTDEKTGNARRRELQKLWAKISESNTKTRKRKKYKVITQLFFQPDDVLALKLSDGRYCGLVCSTITQYRGECTYDLVLTTYQAAALPGERDILASNILGRTIDSGYDRKTTLSLQDGVDTIWRQLGKGENYFFGLAYHRVLHQDMAELKGSLQRVGRLCITESLKKMGSMGGERSLEDFERIYTNLDEHIKVWGLVKTPVSVLVGTSN